MTPYVEELLIKFLWEINKIGCRLFIFGPTESNINNDHEVIFFEMFFVLIIYLDDHLF